jgi:hypothetical protein
MIQEFESRGSVLSTKIVQNKSTGIIFSGSEVTLPDRLEEPENFVFVSFWESGVDER